MINLLYFCNTVLFATPYATAPILLIHLQIIRILLSVCRHRRKNGLLFDCRKCYTYILVKSMCTQLFPLFGRSIHTTLWNINTFYHERVFPAFFEKKKKAICSLSWKIYINFECIIVSYGRKLRFLPWRLYIKSMELVSAGFFSLSLSPYSVDLEPLLNHYMDKWKKKQQRKLFNIQRSYARLYGKSNFFGLLSILHEAK